MNIDIGDFQPTVFMDPGHRRDDGSGGKALSPAPPIG
jgi:hypothetical protein